MIGATHLLCWLTHEHKDYQVQKYKHVRTRKFSVWGIMSYRSFTPCHRHDSLGVFSTGLVRTVAHVESVLCPWQRRLTLIMWPRVRSSFRTTGSDPYWLFHQVYTRHIHQVRPFDVICRTSPCSFKFPGVCQRDRLVLTHQGILLLSQTLAAPAMGSKHG